MYMAELRELQMFLDASDPMTVEAFMEKSETELNSAIADLMSWQASKRRIGASSTVYDEALKIATAVFAMRELQTSLKHLAEMAEEEKAALLDRSTTLV